jgi:hypothetical protein
VLIARSVWSFPLVARRDEGDQIRTTREWNYSAV